MRIETRIEKLEKAFKVDSREEKEWANRLGISVKEFREMWRMLNQMSDEEIAELRRAIDEQLGKEATRTGLSASPSVSE